MSGLTIGGCETCPLSNYTFAELIEEQKKQSPHIPYLIARVEDVAGKSMFFDGCDACAHFAVTYATKDSYSSIRSIHYFRFVKSNESGMHFASVQECTTLRALKESDSFLQCYDRTQVLARVKYALSCLEKQKIDRAYQWIDICLKDPVTNHPEIAEAFAEIGRLLRLGKDGLKQDYPVAQQCLERSLEINPHSMTALSSLGAILGMSGHGIKQDCTRALALFEKMLVIDDNNFFAHACIGELYAVGGKEFEQDYAKAARFFSRALKICPYDSLVTGRLADLYALGGFGLSQNIQLARKLFEQAYEHKPNDIFVLTWYGEFLRVNKKDDTLDYRAKQFLEQALELDPNNYDALVHLGALLAFDEPEKPGNSLRALRLFEKAYAIDPTFGFLLKCMSELLETGGLGLAPDPKRAQQLREELDPDYEQALKNLECSRL